MLIKVFFRIFKNNLNKLKLIPLIKFKRKLVNNFFNNLKILEKLNE